MKIFFTYLVMIHLLYFSNANGQSIPTIIDFSPKSEPVGTLLTITGTNLKNPETVDPNKIIVTIQFASSPTYGTASYPSLKFEKHSMIQFEWDDASPGAMSALSLMQNRFFTDGAGNNKPYTGAVAVNGRAQYDNREVGLIEGGISYADGLQLINAGWDIENHGYYHDPYGNYNNSTNALLNVKQLEALYFQRTGYRMNALVVPANYAGYIQAALDEGYVAASSTGTFDGFQAHPEWLLLGGLNAIPEGFIALRRDFSDNWGSSLPSLKGYVDSLLSGTSATVNKFVRVGSHNLTDQASFTGLINYLEDQSEDRIWVTSMREFAEYKITKTQTAKTEMLVDNILTITLDQSAISNRIRWRDLTLKIDADQIIESVKIIGATASYNPVNKLVNIFKQNPFETTAAAVD